MKAPFLSAALVLASVLTIAVQDPTPAPGADQPLAAGDVAPLFSLNDSKGQLASLGAQPKGWTLIAFYPKALTGG